MKATKKPRSPSELQIFCFSLKYISPSLMSLSPIFPTLSSYLPSPIYIILLVSLSWWEDISHVSESLYIISLVARQADSSKALSLVLDTFWVCSISSTEIDYMDWIGPRLFQWMGLAIWGSAYYSRSVQPKCPCNLKMTKIPWNL